MPHAERLKKRRAWVIFILLGGAAMSSMHHSFGILSVPSFHRVGVSSTWVGVNSMGLPSLCADETGLADAVGDMACGPSEVEIALMRELSCASVIAPSAPCTPAISPESLQLDRHSSTSGTALVSRVSLARTPWHGGERSLSEAPRWHQCMTLRHFVHPESHQKQGKNANHRPTWVTI